MSTGARRSNRTGQAERSSQAVEDLAGSAMMCTVQYFRNVLPVDFRRLASPDLAWSFVCLLLSFFLSFAVGFFLDLKTCPLQA